MTEQRVRVVQVSLPENVWGRLASIADDRGTTVAEVIAETMTRLVPQPRTVDAVVPLVLAGLPDKEIARRLDLTNLAVQTRRRAAGLPANRLH